MWRSTQEYYFQFHSSSWIYLDCWRSNLPENMLDNLQVIRPSQRTDNLQHLQPAWQAQLGTDKGQMQTLKFKVVHIPHFSTLSLTAPKTSPQVWKRRNNRCEALSQSETNMLKKRTLHLHSWVGEGGVWICSGKTSNTWATSLSYIHISAQRIACVDTQSRPVHVQTHRQIHCH